MWPGTSHLEAFQFKGHGWVHRAHTIQMLHSCQCMIETASQCPTVITCTQRALALGMGLHLVFWSHLEQAQCCMAEVTPLSSTNLTLGGGQLRMAGREGEGSAHPGGTQRLKGQACLPMTGQRSPKWLRVPASRMLVICESDKATQREAGLCSWGQSVGCRPGMQGWTWQLAWTRARSGHLCLSGPLPGMHRFLRVRS